LAIVIIAGALCWRCSLTKFTPAEAVECPHQIAGYRA
jgi:hypothetical protein